MIKNRLVGVLTAVLQGGLTKKKKMVRRG